MRYALFLGVGLFAAPLGFEAVKPAIEIVQTSGPKKRKAKKLKKSHKKRKNYDLPCGC